ncbi:MAG: hypothetical protein AB7F74_04430 [Parvibaculaceae bacterium]
MSARLDCATGFPRTEKLTGVSSAAKASAARMLTAASTAPIIRASIAQSPHTLVVVIS